MQNIQFRTYIGEDGILKVQLPAQVNNTELEVLVVFQPTNTPKIDKTAQAQEWPPEFFDKTWGSCAEDPSLDTFPSKPIAPLEKILDENWLP